MLLPRCSGGGVSRHARDDVADLAAFTVRVESDEVDQSGEQQCNASTITVAWFVYGNQHSDPMPDARHPTSNTAYPRLYWYASLVPVRAKMPSLE